MGQYVSVFFFPIEKSQLPPVLARWQDALPLIEERLEDPSKFGLRQSVSRNWWHLTMLDTLCNKLEVSGLNFTSSEIICVCDDELKRAAKALDVVLTRVVVDVPKLGLPDSYIKGYLYLPQHQEAFEQARPELKIAVSTDWGFEATVGFYSFLKSLNAAIQEAIVGNQCLLYVQPY